ncbi:type IV pilus modification protein PilV [Azonexus sp.]|uniref:type IV pilus modification protein PilV n=1 Tax=Azonexus sp. TaxID=1872668 RepID=UPI00283AB4C7|nr:type IV pilus modification protein PilV [Azonexus sp.]
MRTERFRCQTGMSLVEVMVAVFILGAGLLGLAALQGRSLAYAQSSFQRSIAADLAADLADRIRANRSPFLAYTDTGALPPGLLAAPDVSQCSQASDLDSVIGCPEPSSTPLPPGDNAYRVAADMTEWNMALRSQLVNGRWSLTAVPNGPLWRYTLTITWLDNRKDPNGNVDASYVTVIQ